MALGTPTAFRICTPALSLAIRGFCGAPLQFPSSMQQEEPPSLEELLLLPGREVGAAGMGWAAAASAFFSFSPLERWSSRRRKRPNIPDECSELQLSDCNKGNCEMVFRNTTLKFHISKYVYPLYFEGEREGYG